MLILCIHYIALWNIKPNWAKNPELVSGLLFGREYGFVYTIFLFVF